MQPARELVRHCRTGSLAIFLKERPSLFFWIAVKRRLGWEVKETMNAKNRSRWDLHRLWQTVQKFWAKLLALYRRTNARFSHKWPTAYYALLSLGVMFLLAAVMLWLPSYLGMANDGTISRTMQNAGLAYLEADANNANDYFTRVYQTGYAASQDRSLQLVLLWLAKHIDTMFTSDALFDVRFLAGIYLVLALPAWFMLTYAIVSRTDAFIEKTVLCVLCVLVFADVSNITYFNSLYPEALYGIGLSYLFGGCLMLQRTARLTPFFWLAIFGGALIVCMTRRHGAVIGFAAALFCVAQLRLSETLPGRIGISLVAAGVLLAGLFSAAFIETDFDETSHIHAMTRGVLLQSNNPGKTVQEFGIDGSYALLADVSLYDSYALTEEQEPFLQHGFADHYSTADIASHYLRHPGAMVSMLDLGVKSAVNLRREYCGNYERSAGMPAGGKSIFFAAYSIFKSRSLPHTLAFPVMLAVICAVVSRSGWWRKKEPDRFYYTYFCTTMMAVGIILAHLAVVIVCSGDAQLTQYNYIAGYSMDCLILCTLSELLHRLNILSEAQEAK